FTSGSQSDYVSVVTCVDNAAGHDNSGLPSAASFAAGTPQSVSVDQGDQIVCTVTNSRLPQVKLAKTTDPTSDSGTFDLSAGAQTFTNTGAGYGNGQDTGFHNVPQGSLTVSEAGHAPSSLSDYDSSVSCNSGKNRSEEHTSELQAPYDDVSTR